MNGGSSTRKLVYVGRAARAGAGGRLATSALLALPALLASGLACGGEAPRALGSGPPTLLPDGGGLPTLDYHDADEDGLCDDSEASLGTDPEDVDTDADGLPDVIELVSGHEPTLPDDPARDRLALMAGDSGAGLDFEVRFTVEGDGQALTGWFSSLGALYRDGDHAERYFAGSRAVEATPVDAARSIEQDSARFEAVLGKTRLSFVLRFELGDESERSCARAYPFRYAIKSDDGQTRVERTYLLVIGESGATRLTAERFCLPADCD